MSRPLQVFHERISRLRSKLDRLEIDAILLLNPANIRYLTDFSGSDGALVIGGARAFLLVDGRYVTQAQDEAKGAEVIEYRDKIDGIVQVACDSGFKAVGFESMSMYVDQFLKLQARLQGLQLKPVFEEIEYIRAIKDSLEEERMKKAAETASGAFHSILDFIKPGVRERDIALELDYRLKSAGAEDCSFNTIVASGTNTALPHARPGFREFTRGDFIIFDYGAVYMGYHSDETCTVALGDADLRQRKVYQVVKDAHDMTIDAVKAGISCKAVDHIARDYIDKKGFGPYFRHGTGHGVGLEVHEPPRIAYNSDAVLEAGMIVTIEPGIYIPGQWGVRIEDMVLVKENGYEVLTKATKDFRLVG
ncbi:MAG: M24 family metallopeptidase [Syntrophales bacterium]